MIEKIVFGLALGSALVLLFRVAPQMGRLETKVKHLQDAITHLCEAVIKDKK